jgi:hypothetical protein
MSFVVIYFVCLLLAKTLLLEVRSMAINGDKKVEAPVPIPPTPEVNKFLLKIKKTNII